METAGTPVDRETLAARVISFPRVAADRPDLKQAGVALCVTEADGDTCPTAAGLPRR